MYDHTVLNSMVERWREGGSKGEGEREGGREREVGGFGHFNDTWFQ